MAGIELIPKLGEKAAYFAEYIQFVQKMMEDELSSHGSFATGVSTTSSESMSTGPEACLPGDEESCSEAYTWQDFCLSYICWQIPHPLRVVVQECSPSQLQILVLYAYGMVLASEISPIMRVSLQPVADKLSPFITSAPRDVELQAEESIYLVHKQALTRAFRYAADLLGQLPVVGVFSSPQAATASQSIAPGELAAATTTAIPAGNGRPPGAMPRRRLTVKTRICTRPNELTSRVVSPNQEAPRSTKESLKNWRANLKHAWGMVKGSRTGLTKPDKCSDEAWTSFISERQKLANLIDKLVGTNYLESARANIEKIQVLLGRRDKWL
jgi:hypothetical protein